MSESRGHHTSDAIRVCVINPNFYRSSGITVAIRMIYAATNRLGVEQSFVSCGYGDEEQDTEWIPHDRFASFRLMDSNPIVVTRGLQVLAAWLRERGVQVIHVHHRRLALILCACRPFFQCRVVYTGHLTYPLAPWFWPVRPDAATAVSNSVASNMRLTTRAQNVQVISNPVRFPKGVRSPAQENIQFDAVCVGRLEPVKGHENLIKAWGILRDEGYGAKLALVGEGSSEGRLRTLIREKRLSDLIEFRGFRSDIGSEFEKGRFGILVSRVEGQGIVVIEAAACGRASLLTNVDGLRDGLPADRGLPNGLLYGDVSALVSALRMWLSNPDLVAQEGQRFFEFFRHSSSMDVVGRQYAALYRQFAFQNGG